MSILGSRIATFDRWARPRLRTDPADLHTVGVLDALRADTNQLKLATFLATLAALILAILQRRDGPYLIRRLTLVLAMLALVVYVSSFARVLFS